MTEPTDLPPLPPLVTAGVVAGLACYGLVVVWLLAHVVPATLELVAGLAARIPGQLATAPVWVQILVGVTVVVGLGALVWAARPQEST
jgi:hypothetical protein